MARTPSMTVAEAEAAIGARGKIVVTAENRGLVRKWFVAQGLPALFVGGLSMRELALAYNDTTGEQYTRLLRKYEEAKDAAGEARRSRIRLSRQTRQSRQRRARATATQMVTPRPCSKCSAKP